MTIVVHAWIRSRDHFLKKNLKKMVPLRTDFVKGRVSLRSVDGSRRLPLLQNCLNDPTHWAAGVGFPCKHADHRRSSGCGGDTTVCAANQCVFRVTSLPNSSRIPSTLFTVGGMRLLAMAYDSSTKPRSPYRCRNVSRSASSIRPAAWHALSTNRVHVIFRFVRGSAILADSKTEKSVQPKVIGMTGHKSW